MKWQGYVNDSLSAETAEREHCSLCDKFNKENIKKICIFLLFTILPVPKVNRKKE